VNYPLLNAFLTMLWFFLWVIWLYLLFFIIFDIFRSQDLSGGAKAGWLILVVLLPFLGVCIYLIARGGRMHERQVRQVQAQDEAVRSYARHAARDLQASDGTDGQADELAKLAELRTRGAISESEYERAKAKVLG
jgi:signal transduction histidine kinase